MKTSLKEEIEMDASAEVSFSFKFGNETRTFSHEFSMEEFIKDPWEYGSLMRSIFFADRRGASEYFEEA